MKYFIAFAATNFLFNFFIGCTPLTAADRQQTVVAVAVDDPAKPSVKDSDAGAEDILPRIFEPVSFENPKVCSTCHRDIYDEWSKSMHANAWEDKWYQPDYILAHQQTNGATDILCGACHAPVAARTGLLPPADGSQFDATSRRGISCDFCHTVSGVGQMFNMGHISAPGPVKRGPRGDGRSLYHEVKFSEIHTKADFCGSCHMVIHPATGTHIIDTWDDWQNNAYGRQGIRCQDCHMTPTPAVTKRPGRAALLGKKRENLAFHGFIGGSSYVQDELGNKPQAEMSREFLRAAAEVELADHLTPGQPRHVEINDDAVVSISLQSGHRRQSVGTDGHLVPLAWQLDPHQLLQTAFVIGKQNSQSVRLLACDSDSPHLKRARSRPFPIPCRYPH